MRIKIKNTTFKFQLLSPTRIKGINAWKSFTYDIDLIINLSHVSEARCRNMLKAILSEWKSFTYDIDLIINLSHVNKARCRGMFKAILNEWKSFTYDIDLIINLSHVSQARCRKMLKAILSESFTGDNITHRLSRWTGKTRTTVALFRATLTMCGIILRGSLDSPQKYRLNKPCNSERTALHQHAFKI